MLLGIELRFSKSSESGEFSHYTMYNVSCLHYTYMEDLSGRLVAFV